MSQFTDWYPVENPTQGTLGGTNWANLANIAVDDANFSDADASGGAWANESTEVVTIRGNSALDPLIPDGSTFQSVEVRMYFDLPQNLLVIPQASIFRSSSQSTPTFAEGLGSLGPTAEIKTIPYAKVVDDAQGRLIAEGGSILFVYSAYTPATPEAGQWQLNWRFAEMRLEYTLPPFISNTPFIAMF